MNKIKNIKHETVIRLIDEIEVKEGQIISKTLVQNKAVSLTLFAFSKGEEISTHKSEGDALVTVIEGKIRFTVDENDYILSAGDSLVMPAGKPHSVWGEEDGKWILNVVF